MSGSLVSDKRCHGIDIQFQQATHSTTKTAKHDAADRCGKIVQFDRELLVQNDFDVDRGGIFGRVTNTVLTVTVITIEQLGTELWSITGKAVSKCLDASTI